MRLIDKLPQAPDLNEKSVRMISDLLFVPDKPFNQNYGDCGKYDTKSALQIMGNIAFLKDMFHGTVLSKVSAYCPNVSCLIITGGINPAYTEDTEETRLVKQLYTEHGKYDWTDVLTIPQSVIMYTRLLTIPDNPLLSKKTLLETDSTNTRANFVSVYEKGWYDGIKQLRLLTTAESALRVTATARKILPRMKDIGTISYVATFPELNIKCDKDNWAKHPLSRRYVYGEFLRVVKYNEMAEIKLTDVEKAKLNCAIQELSEQR
jgi:hypothetical protein